MRRWKRPSTSFALFRLGPGGLNCGLTPLSASGTSGSATYAPHARDQRNVVKRLASAGGSQLISDALGKIGAGEGARTLDPDLGKVVLYH